MGGGAWWAAAHGARECYHIQEILGSACSILVGEVQRVHQVNGETDAGGCSDM